MSNHKHMNQNLPCTIAIRTTHYLPGEADLLEICIMPITRSWEPDMEMFRPIHMIVQPTDPESIDIEAINTHKRLDNNLDHSPYTWSLEFLATATTGGIDQHVAGEYLVDWFEKLNLNTKKRLMLIGYNMPYVEQVLTRWLGPKTCEYMFFPQKRDVLSIGLFYNDVSDVRMNVQWPFAKCNLQYLCSQLNVPRYRYRTTLDDCASICSVYRSMIHKWF